MSYSSSWRRYVRAHTAASPRAAPQQLDSWVSNVSIRRDQRFYLHDFRSNDLLLYPGTQTGGYLRPSLWHRVCHTGYHRISGSAWRRLAYNKYRCCTKDCVARLAYLYGWDWNAGVLHTLVSWARDLHASKNDSDGRQWTNRHGKTPDRSIFLEMAFLFDLLCIGHDHCELKPPVSQVSALIC